MDTKTKILLASIKFFLKKGYDSTSISDISSAVGIKKSSIYYHFKNKEAIFIHAIKYLIQEFDQTVSKSIDNLDSSKNMLWNIYLSLIEFNKQYLEEESNTMNILYLFYIAKNKFPEQLGYDIHNYYKNLFDTVNFIVRLGQQRGEIKKDFSHRLLTYKIVSWLEGIHVFSFFYNDFNISFSKEELFNNIWFMMNEKQTTTKNKKSMPKTISLGTKW